MSLAKTNTELGNVKSKLEGILNYLRNRQKTCLKLNYKVLFVLQEF